MAFATSYRQPLALLLFNATGITGVADNTATSPITSVFASLHTADPSTGNQTTSEATYTGYLRGSAVRTSSGYTCSGGVITNTATLAFPACTGGSNTLTYVGIGTLTTGTGSLWVAGALTSSLAVSTGITPQFSASGLSITIA